MAFSLPYVHKLFLNKIRRGRRWLAYRLGSKVEVYAADHSECVSAMQSLYLFRLHFDKKPGGSP